MAMIVADTDVLIDALHGKEPSAGRITLELATGRLATTAITVFELESGARGPKQRDQVQALLAAMNLLPLNQKAAQRAAEIRRELEAKGQRIGTAAYPIAGIVLEHSGILLTRNRAHFERVPGLILGTEICDSDQAFSPPGLALRSLEGGGCYSLCLARDGPGGYGQKAGTVALNLVSMDHEY